MKFLNFSTFVGHLLPSWYRISDPDTDPLTWLNPDPDLETLIGSRAFPQLLPPFDLAKTFLINPGCEYWCDASSHPGCQAGHSRRHGAPLRLWRQVREIYHTWIQHTLSNSVGDPWHFCADPDPRIPGSVPLTNGSGSEFFQNWF